MLLGDICYFHNGKAIPKDLVGCFPVYGSTGIIGFTSKPLITGDSILIARVGAQCGKVQFAEGSYWVSDNTIICQPQSKNYLTKYLYYQLSALDINAFKVGSAQPLLNSKILSSIEIPHATLEEQRHIVGTTSSLQ